MTLQLNLPEKLAERLRQKAETLGQPIEAIALNLLEQHLPPLDERRAAACLLCCNSGWRKMHLRRVPMMRTSSSATSTLRGTSNRVLFPPEFKGITW